MRQQFEERTIKGMPEGIPFIIAVIADIAGIARNQRQTTVIADRVFLRVSVPPW